MLLTPDTNLMLPALSTTQQQDLVQFGRRVNRLGADFAVLDALHSVLLFCSHSGDPAPREDLGAAAATVLSETTLRDGVDDDGIRMLAGPRRLLAAELPVSRTLGNQPQARLVGLIDLGLAASPGEEDDAGRSQVLRELFGCHLDGARAAAQADCQIDLVGCELSQVYEELVLLHKLSTNMKLTETDANFLQLACDSLTDVVAVEGIAIVVERWTEHERRWMVVAGSGLIDLNPNLAATVFTRLQDEVSAGRDALLDSDVFGGLKFTWPDTVRNLIAVPLFGKDPHDTQWVARPEQERAMIGYMVAVNAIEKADFDSPDVKLFNSVASRCAVFIENGRLFGDLQGLFMGSLRALTSSIDAKDTYTHGHSERVALISRWIAEQAVGAGVLRVEQAHEAYFAGLLHDIGKIGVDDWVLRKEGRLTEAELARIHNHPAIGAGILRGIKQMQVIVPGVLYHHERFDGHGYPHGLTAEEIPVLARIVCLADSFDAMTSRRSYRQARSYDEAAAEIRQHLGSQFDPVLGDIFLNSDISRLWDLMLGGNALHYGRDVADYGATAVGSLIR